MSKDRDNDDRKLETVLVMQGGGSLGAYECGVYKALSKHGKRFDIVAGTSIGAINAALITSSIPDDNPSKKLENFWLTLAQSIGSPIAFSLSDKNRASKNGIDGNLMETVETKCLLCKEKGYHTFSRTSSCS